MGSPYDDIDPAHWLQRTKELVGAHPLGSDEIVDVVLGSWRAIFKSRVGALRIGLDITPKPQIMGFFLHELIPREFQRRYPKVWCQERTAADKDLVCLTDPTFSVELKTSSHALQIFGNRSYTQAGDSSKKSKSGYYLAVNFEAFQKGRAPKIKVVRFGWLDDTDWIGQRSQTGQQARIAPAVEKAKLLTLYRSA